MILSKEQILKAEDLKRETVPVPEWGGEVIVRTMTGAERDAFEGEITAKKGVNRDNIRAKLLARVIIGEDGKRIFDDNEIADLGDKSSSVLDRLFGIAQRLNGIGAKDVEEMEKNSEAGE